MTLKIRSGVARRTGLLASICAISCLGFASSASGHFAPGGQLLKLTHLGFNTNTSSNWFGYEQGSIQEGGKLFKSIAGNWRVPRARQHTSGQAEDSADWIGIGGGCVDASCAIGDNTLIQTGTEQDVASNGSASYHAWYELVPAPEFQITSMKVRPGNRMHASLTQTAPEVWKISIRDITRRESYSTTLPYSSTTDTAEWIEETPLEIGTSPGLAALPNLTRVHFGSLRINGAGPHLTSAEKIKLTNSAGKVIGTPSGPNSRRNGFDECAWRKRCR